MYTSVIYLYYIKASQETFKRRLDTYKTHTEPLLKYYELNGSRLTTIKGNTSDEIWPQLNNLLKSKYKL